MCDASIFPARKQVSHHEADSLQQLLHVFMRKGKADMELNKTEDSLFPNRDSAQSTAPFSQLIFDATI
jgi:hypothetical protein